MTLNATKKLATQENTEAFSTASTQSNPSLSGSRDPDEAKPDSNVTDGCCGGPAPEETNACCVKDADAKANGQSGCGCGDAKASGPNASTQTCCG